MLERSIMWGYLLSNEHNLQRDTFLVVVGGIIVFFLTLVFDLFDHIIEFLVTHEAWELDEFFTLTAYTTVALLIFSYRRWKEANRELVSRKELEKDLIRAKNEADIANMRLSKFLADMSHELRTPLNSVIGFSEMLQDDTFGPLNEKQMDYVRNISMSGSHLLHLINQLLDLAKIESGKVGMNIEEFHVQELFDEVGSILEVLARKKKVDLTYDIDAELDILNADKVKMKQMLFNLASNAIKFTPEEGHVKLEAKKDGDMVLIRVTDSGHGIDAAGLRKIFEPFEQLGTTEETGYKGTGLGLSIVQELAILHKGKVWVESELGNGSTFFLKLPINLSITH
ncbi:Signal transduction histidine kinase [Methanolobus profundi]|uniref:histidine kinase n=1 Tax=Methanolobus profundi TaxID=487685 RepID=A0A1I4RTC4_9EURY|nr:Signal transduction histidine kinase [Methanolobus profundi]